MVPAIDRQYGAIDVASRPGAQEDHGGRDILGTTEASIRMFLRHRFLPAHGLHQAVGHPARKEAWCERVAEDMPWA